MTGSRGSREIQKHREILADWCADLLKTAKVTAPFQYTIGLKWAHENFTFDEFSRKWRALEDDFRTMPTIQVPAIYVSK
jgi:hypothetical protein